MGKFVQSLRVHETTIVEMAAVLTAAPRWIITFMPIDRAKLDAVIQSMGGVWDFASAILSIAFAVVEIWATAMIMRAFNMASDRKDKALLFVAWLVSLTVLAFAQIPPLYASLHGVSVTTLGGWEVIYVVAVSIAAFVVIAGVSYADKVYGKTPSYNSGTMTINEFRKKVHDDLKDINEEEGYVKSIPVGEAAIGVDEALVYNSDRSDERIPVIDYKDFVAQMKGLGDEAPSTGAQVEKRFHLAHNTSYKYFRKWSQESKS